MAVKVFRSTDSGAPAMIGGSGKLIDLLDACLVNGYGSVMATGSVTSSGVNVSDGDTVTIGTKTYTFKTALAGVVNQVLIGASAAASLANLALAINNNGTPGTTYVTGTRSNADVYCSAITSTVLTLKARKGGTGGNALALSKVAATLTVSGANLSGGSGADTTTPVGWTKAFTVADNDQATYQAPAGLQQYFHIDDNGADFTLVGNEGAVRGSETATAFNTGTGLFGTFTSLVLDKSSTRDTTTRRWIVVADDRTAIVFVDYNGTPGWSCMIFGEFYSILGGADNYRSIVGGSPQNTQSTQPGLVQLAILVSTAATPQMTIARTYTGLGGGVNCNQVGDAARSNGVTSALMQSNGLSFPNGPDGAIHISPLHIVQPVNNIRGRWRGFFQGCHNVSNFTDLDTVTGAGAYAGRTFLILKGTPNFVGGFCVDITGPWETN